VGISFEEVKYIAELARLELTPEEKEVFTEQLQNILEFMDKLKKVDTENVEPAAHVSGVGTFFSEDKVKSLLSYEKIFKNAPDAEDGYFVVPRTVSE